MKFCDGVRLAKRGEAKCQSWSSKGNCGEPAAVIVLYGWPNDIPLCAKHYAETRRPEEPTVIDLWKKGKIDCSDGG